MHAAVVSNHRSQILASYDTDAVACQHLPNRTSSNWSCKDGLLLYKALIYVPETLRMDMLCEHHDSPLTGHCGIAKTLELIIRIVRSSVSTSSSKTMSILALYVNMQKFLAISAMENSLRSPFPRLPGRVLLATSSLTYLSHAAWISILVFVDRMTKMSHFIP